MLQVDHPKIAEPFRQISLGNAKPVVVVIENSLDKQTIVLGGHTDMPECNTWLDLKSKADWHCVTSFGPALAFHARHLVTKTGAELFPVQG